MDDKATENNKRPKNVLESSKQLPEFNLFMPYEPRDPEKEAKIGKLHDEIFSLRVMIRDKQREIKNLKMSQQ